MFSAVFTVAALCLIANVSSFRLPAKAFVKSSKKLSMSVFDKAVEDWAAQYPAAYAVGWGPTTKAERWNGRHAMFGWIALITTAYAKGHGLIPNADSILDLKEWGTLAYIYGGSITNERAVILVGHLHLLLFSVCAAVAPLSFQDKLYIGEGEEAEPAAGLIPKIVPGLTKEAELLNGRLAMLGLTVLLTVSTVNQTPILDVINAGVGGLLF
mmetsp:Transcript_13607/g.18628  ORF Transcript_13607/g.18628 Transcript_13607/m.18628 type:complete len:212 (+) Transcript_13607:79-714(+)|eukprot:CAMPEP_0201098046 /NCGR_PEP_ID=MMETSP0812-20130820/7075_1 /ASSEMBLY_ACC=CAM_ASM_000668 /TAXON_ID=98059 /ORGANISM="Dinobryon sp., Strain UTEXLB2267" /LENGTH=211 /DNA_ID=CAMNT_0047353245 /DNA_START=90 /DNA_END=725 /DNA_ORIENTATION=-